jgi:hypothetical protein
MADMKEKVEAEYENITRLLDEMPDKERLPYLSFLELAGVATLLHNFYNGVENILKQCMISKNLSIPSSNSWHKDLLTSSVQNNILTSETMFLLGEYLAFRHFFSHAYALDLYADKMEPLVENIQSTFVAFKAEIDIILR